MIEAFIVCALAMPPSSFTRPTIASYHAMNDEEIAERIRQIYDVEEVFIHEHPQVDKLKEYGWEKFPAKWKDKEIWIKRRPATDGPKKRAMETSA